MDALIIQLGVMAVHRGGVSQSDLPMLTENLVAEQGTESRSSDVRSRLSCKSVIGMSMHAKEWV